MGVVDGEGVGVLDGDVGVDDGDAGVADGEVGVTDGEGFEDGDCEGDVGEIVGEILGGAVGGGGVTQVEEVHALDPEIHSLPEMMGLSLRLLKNKIKKNEMENKKDKSKLRTTPHNQKKEIQQMGMSVRF